ncbi:MAG TPA: sulfotransferase [Rhizomicrobium sp.]|nr:sulfotransferase [Rhizomicrobium sp.]
MSLNQTADAAAPAAASSAEVRRLLNSDPPAAEERARDILKAQPENADALLVLAAALRRQRKVAEAKAILEPLVALQPDSAFAQLEFGLALESLGQHWEAIASFASAIDLAPTFVDAWCALAGALAHSEGGPGKGAASAIELVAATMKSRRFSEAESALRELIEREPECQPTRLLYAVALLAQDKGHLALGVLDDLLRRDPAKSFYRELRASALYDAGDFHQAIAEYELLLGDGHKRPGAWISLGRALRAIGRQDECVAAFWKAVEILPVFAAGYRTLATVKTIRFAPPIIDHLRGLLARPGLLTATRAQLHFALGKALQDAQRYAESFENYRLSNEFQSTGVSGATEPFLDLAGRSRAVFTPEFFRLREGAGCASAEPIFVVGMPRAGSTLVQEILAAHSAIERTGELRDLSQLAMRLRAGRPGDRHAYRYPEMLGFADIGLFRSLGEEYLERTRPRRKAGSPFFVDKLPENFIYTGLIHLIFPGARIIDVRRHPLDCCLSCFTNYLPEGPQWLHSLDDLGRYYAGYVELMAHFDEVLPGRVHRVFYEHLVEDPEKEVRRLLGHLGLPFEENCLHFYEREQAIVTVSVEQARRPIYRGSIGNSRKFEPWLAPLKKALGQVLDAYPEVPNFYPALRASFSLRLA